MAETFLEKSLYNSLIKRDLIDEPKRKVYYKRDEFGGSYRNIRRWFLENITPLSLAGLATAGGVGYFFPKTAAGIGAVSFGGLIGDKILPIDDYLYKNSSKIAKREFRKSNRNWKDCYEKFKIKSKKDLDLKVLMVELPSAVYEEFPDNSDQKALGIITAKIADTLHSTRVEKRMLSGLKTKHLVEMVADMTLEDSYDMNRIDSLISRLSFSEIGYYIDRKYKEIPDLDILQKYLKDYELVLRIPDGGEVQYTGFELSKGHIMIDNDAGPNAGKHMGIHSKMKDFPRMTVKDEVAHSFMSESSRGFSVVHGDADQGFMEGSTGGVGIVRGTIKGRIARDMTDKSWPAIVISIDGLYEELHEDDIENGLVFSLYRDVTMQHKPVFYRFNQGKITVEYFPEGIKPTHHAANVCDEYIQKWKRG